MNYLIKQVETLRGLLENVDDRVNRNESNYLVASSYITSLASRIQELEKVPKQVKALEIKLNVIQTKTDTQIPHRIDLLETKVNTLESIEKQDTNEPAVDWNYYIGNPVWVNCPKGKILGILERVDLDLLRPFKVKINTAAEEGTRYSECKPFIEGETPE